MIYVEVSALKTEERGRATANHWEDTDDIATAIDVALDRFHATYDLLGYGAIQQYTITVATEASPRRTVGDR